MSGYIPQEGDLMIDDEWVIPADGKPPFRIKGENK
jgi:hypothetical protein